MLPRVEYLGDSISAKGIQPVREKVRAIRDAPQPQNISQLRSFLGILNYYGKFLPSFATLLRPLYDLLQSTKKWSWETSQNQAFNKAKGLLSSPLLLTHDSRKPCVLLCDASPYGVGTVLSHRMGDLSGQLIAYAYIPFHLLSSNMHNKTKNLSVLFSGSNTFISTCTVTTLLYYRITSLFGICLEKPGPFHHWLLPVSSAGQYVECL